MESSLEVLFPSMQPNLDVAEADVWERLHVDREYFKDQSKLMLEESSCWIEAFSAGNRTSGTVKVNLSQIFANF